MSYLQLELVTTQRAGPEDGAASVESMKRSAEWARAPGIRSTMSDLWSGDGADETLAKVCNPLLGLRKLLYH